METEEHQNQTAKELELASAREGAVMALFGICFSSSNHGPLMQIQRNIHFAKTHIPKAENADKSSPCSSISKRSLNLSVVTFILSVPFPAIPTAMAEQEVELQRYTDLREGFTLLIPSSYVKVNKAGATVLFEEMLRRTNSIRVVVNPVRLMSLRDFGSPQFVAETLIQAEKRKGLGKEAVVGSMGCGGGGGGGGGAVVGGRGDS
ncbi:hypothetical protein Nepgr_012237 [Nepenthes gracilis]|uniref:PsbP C-terminal domain-containing protein n=1 Tax=Nepenthes gracilis TaxID=150966 RepID=A0AAD3XN40_NEPGR|nr:hypothetical protein Nepgr_012237 [Nepenthes gracilis]